MTGRTLSHYKVLEKIGEGGMGVVYLAEDTRLSRKVALKVLPPEMAENAERRARFEREAKAVAALDHPNIVTIYSVEEAAGVHFHTMQLVKGKTLTELIPKKSAFATRPPKPRRRRKATARQGLAAQQVLRDCDCSGRCGQCRTWALGLPPKSDRVIVMRPN